MDYLIFGTGGVGVKCKDKLEQEGHRISAFLDNDVDKQGKLIGNIKICSPLDANVIQFDMIAIGVYKAAPSIRKQLLEMGIPNEKICVPIEPNRIFINNSIDYESHLPDEEEMSESTKDFFSKRKELDDQEFIDKLTDLKCVLVNNNIPFQNVCVCSGAVFQAYGLRKSKKFDDIDVIMTSDYRELYGKGLVIISETAEMHKQDEYDIPDDEIIGNPDNHFWFQGLKFMNIEFLL